jgi:Icc-related predicted phosphoesterase
MVIDIISDLHGAKPNLEGGDLLILAGDYTSADTTGQWLAFREWLRDQKYTKKIMIGGNHDMAIFNGNFYFDEQWLGATWLNDSGTEFVHYPGLEVATEDGMPVYREKLKIWGSPWTAWFDGINPRCTAWTLKTDKKLAEKWALIPGDIDILITHSPPFGILDEAMHTHNYQSVGSKSLLARVHKIRPKLHIYGHIHEGYGQYKADGVHFINASIMDVNYKPSNKPVRIEL